jgi:hypothetical protein
MIAGVTDDSRVKLSQWQLHMLDGLAPKQRHELSDLWHHDRYRLLAVADAFDRGADLISRVGPIGTLDDDHMVASALRAEAFRALARDDLDRARELFESSGRWAPESGAHGKRLLDFFGGGPQQQ